jgi:hypothetical protein
MTGAWSARAPGFDGDLARSPRAHIALRLSVLEVMSDAWRHVRAEWHERRAAQSFSGEFRLSPMTLERFLCDAKANETELWRLAVAYVVSKLVTKTSMSSQRIAAGMPTCRPTAKACGGIG